MSLFIDKINLSHWTYIPKSVDESYFVHMHLVCVLVFSREILSRIFLNYENFPNDANLVITIIQIIIAGIGIRIEICLNTKRRVNKLR